MLILSRKKGETIQIGNNIEITITAIKGDQVKIGIKAPNKVEIHRKEVYEKIQEENKNASNISSDLLFQFSRNMNDRNK